MSDAKTNEEPSIEEILGSIRRIIADDDDQANANPASVPSSYATPTGGDIGSLDEDEDETPLELTQKIDEDGTVIDLNTDESAYNEQDDVPQQAAYQPEPAALVSTSATPQQEIAMVDFDEPTQAPADTLVSNVAADATAAVMAKLARNTAVNRSGPDGVTIEDLVKDMLRPMLRSWLDENLPDMVQSMVERELERISRRVN